MKFLTFDNIYKVVTLVAVGYLIFQVLSIFNVSSKQIQKIEDSQKQIEQSAKDVIANHNKTQAIADSIDQIHIKEIQSLTTEIKTLKVQLKSVETEIKSYKDVFDKNKVDLPNPWQK